LGSDTASLFKAAAQDAIDNFDPEAIIVGASCTAELIQDDPAGLAETMGLDIPVIPLELPSYSRKENFGGGSTCMLWPLLARRPAISPNCLPPISTCF